MFNKRALAATLLFGFLASLLITIPTASPVAAQSADGLTATGDYRYLVDPDAGVVNVEYDMAITNTSPNQSVRGGYRYFYFEGYATLIPASATDLTVTQEGVDLEFERVDNGELVDYLDFGFRRNLRYNRTANVEIRYTLPDDGPRSDSPARVNGAYAGFLVWTDTGLDSADVSITLPEGFDDVDTRLIQLANTKNDDGTRTLTKTEIEPNDDFFSFVSFRNDDALTSVEVEVDGMNFEIRHWPGDTMWADFVTDRLEDDLPTMVDLVGLEWPASTPLTIIESYTPYLSGYGGWYDKSEQTIEVGDQLDEHLILHELAHVWFNQDFIDARWATEGLADEFAAATLSTRGAPVEPDGASLVDANAQPLNLWNRFAAAEEEDWGYAASWTVAHEINEEIGLENFTSVVQAMDNRTLPYVGEGEAETLSGEPTWKNYLDWIEEAGTTDEVTELFDDWVVSLTNDPFEDRADARQRYAELAEAGGEWAVPLIVREHMTDWQFEDATAEIETAMTVLADRDRALSAVSGLGLDLQIPDDAETLYQSVTANTADDPWAEAETATTELADAAELLVTTHETANASQPFFTNIGLMGTDIPAEISDANAAFEAGDFDQLAAEAEGIDQMVADAKTDGQVRVGAAAGGVLVLVLLIFLGLRRRRKKKTARSEAPEDGESNPSSAAEPVGERGDVMPTATVPDDASSLLGDDEMTPTT